MTATPIPRTLAVILYGDLDISVINEMPPGRKPVITKAIVPSEREKAYRFIRGEIEKGHQAYVVAPLIEESMEIDAKSATELFNELCGHFGKARIRLLHGAMKQTEKDEAMNAFIKKTGKYSGFDGSYRSRHQYSKRQCHADRKRRKIRAGCAPPASGKGRKRRGSVVLLSDH